MTCSRWPMDRFRVVVFVLVAIDLACHLVTFADGPVPLVLDAAQYWSIGGMVVDGDWFQLEAADASRTPVYPYYVALNRGLFGQYALFSLIVLQHVFVFTTSIITGLAGARLCRNRWAFVAGYAANLLFLTRLWNANAVVTETMFTLLFAIAIVLILFYHQTPRLKYAIGAGLFFGLATLVRPVPQLLAPVLAGTIFLHAFLRDDRLKLKKAFGHTAVFVLTSTLVLLPCFIRNKVIYDQFFLTKLSAINKWDVSFHGGSCANLPWPETPAARQLTELLGSTSNQLDTRHSNTVLKRLREKGLEADEAHTLMTRVCHDAIQRHPGKFFWKAFKRTVNYWRCIAGWPPYSNDPSPTLMDQYVWRWDLIADPYRSVLQRAPATSLWWNQLFSLAVWLSVVRLMWRRETRLGGIAFALTFLYFCTVTGLVEIENYRYRMILEPAMVLCVVQAGFLRSKHRDVASKS